MNRTLLHCPNPDVSLRPRIWTVSTSTTLVDGFTGTYKGIRGGDIVELAPGTRATTLTMKNLIGTKERPIIVRNGPGGEVIAASTVADASGYKYGFFFCQFKHVRFTGSGYGQTYGIRVTTAEGHGIRMGNKINHVEIDHIKVEAIGALGSYTIGMHLQTYPSTHPSGWGDYDYNGDGSNDVCTRATHSDGPIWIHHCYWDGNFVTDMGVYLGHSNPNDPPDAEGTHTDYPYVYGLEFSFNYLTRIAQTGIQFGSCMEGLRIHDNTIINCISGYVSNVSAININPSKDINIYNNWIQNINGDGIISQADGGRFFNNLLVDIGLTGSSYNYGIVVIEKNANYSTTQPTYIFNNTLINPRDYGIAFNPSVAGSKFIRNNITIVNPSNRARSLPADGTYTVSDNYDNAVIANAGFTNSAGDDYTLTSGSVCRNAGFDVSAYGINTDGTGINRRPQGSAFDQGCYEYVE